MPALPRALDLLHAILRGCAPSPAVAQFARSAVGGVRRWRAAGWLANVVGLALLANVGRVAVRPSALPFAWPDVSPRLQLAMYLPYAWIGPVCVGGALAGHVILTRALLHARAPGDP